MMGINASEVSETRILGCVGPFIISVTGENNDDVSIRSADCSFSAQKQRPDSINPKKQTVKAVS